MIHEQTQQTANSCRRVLSASQPSCQLRPFQPGEAADLLNLFRDTIRRVNCRDYAPDQIAAWASDTIDPRTWEAQFASRFTCVAERDGVIVGFADLEANGHLDRFYIHADYQRQGIGQYLLREMESEAQRRRLPRLFTEASITARPFFESQGFVTLAGQTVACRGASFKNFRMEKILPSAP